MIDTAQLVQDVLDGKEDPIKALFLAKKLAKELKEHIEVIEVEAFNQNEYEDRIFEKNGFKVEKRNGRKQWNFKKCESYKIAKTNLTEIENELKENFSLFEKGKKDNVIEKVTRDGKTYFNINDYN